MSNRNAAELAARITTARTTADMTLRSLSDKTGIPYPTLNRKLAVAPELFTVQDVSKIAVVLDVDFASLMSGEVNL